MKNLRRYRDSWHSCNSERVNNLFICFGPIPRDFHQKHISIYISAILSRPSRDQKSMETVCSGVCVIASDYDRKKELTHCNHHLYRRHGRRRHFNQLQTFEVTVLTKHSIEINYEGQHFEKYPLFYFCVEWRKFFSPSMKC